jgi:S1-C subfamily serine protease
MIQKLTITLFLMITSPLLYSSSSDLNHLIENEKNTISIFRNSVNSVVNVTNIQLARRRWGFGAVEVPAGSGTGFIWDNQGHIITNYHVVENGDRFLISFHKDNQQYEARKVGVDASKDIAVLKLTKIPPQLSKIKVGSSSNLLVGQKTIAIGNPFQLSHTMTSGIISALERKIDGYGGVKIPGMIQTDASINPGNSGGPLLDSQGALIGMNTMIFSQSGSSAGVGFALPVNTIKSLVPQLIKHGKVIRPALGIIILPPHLMARFDLDPNLVVIAALAPGGAAEKAGLNGMSRDRYGRVYLGDIILTIDGKKVTNLESVYQLLDNYTVGNRVTIIYQRENKTKKTTLVLQSR